MFDPLVPIVTFLVTAGIKEFAEKVLKQEYNSNWSAVTAAVIAAGLLLANSLGALLPKEWLPVVGQIVQFVVLVASAFGIHATAVMIKGK